MRRIGTVLLLFLLFAAIGTAQTVNIDVGETRYHTLKVFNPLPSTDTVQIELSLSGADTEAVNTKVVSFPNRQDFTIQVDAETNRSLAIEFKGVSCTKASCQAQIDFAATSLTTGLSSDLSIPVSVSPIGETSVAGSAPGITFVHIVLLMALGAATFALWQPRS